MHCEQRSLCRHPAPCLQYLPESIPRLHKFPAPNEFLNDYVLANLPFVVRCDESHCFPAVELWKDPKYLRKLMEEKTVTVGVTPTGHANSIVDDRCVIPEERTILFDDFFDEFLKDQSFQVYNLQKQNNLNEEFSPLVKDIASHVPSATEAFGNQPAANIWMGDHRSVTSIHRDHYENIYYVITGQKKFNLYPPVSIAWMPYGKYKKFQWYFEKESSVLGEWHMKDLNEEVEWIFPSHKPETQEKFLMLFKTKSYGIYLDPGEALYLPAMWFHEDRQTTKCIAVNYLYDIKYDVKYPFLNLLNKLCNMPVLQRDASVDRQTELEYSLLSEVLERKKVALRRKEKKNVHK